MLHVDNQENLKNCWSFIWRKHSKDLEFVQNWTIHGYNKLRTGLTNTHLSKGEVWRWMLLSPSFWEGIIQKKMGSLTVEAWISLDFSDLLYTVFNFILIEFIRVTLPINSIYLLLISWYCQRNWDFLLTIVKCRNFSLFCLLLCIWCLEESQDINICERNVL